jgi:MerR family transcriptional regulator/heat shock protein HspR
MAIEVAKLRLEVDALIQENPPKALGKGKSSQVIVYKEES